MKVTTEELKNLCFDMHQGINTVTEKIEYQNKGIPIIQSKHITKGFLDLNTARYVNNELFEKYQEKYRPQSGDLLVCNIGTIGRSILIEEEIDFLIAWNLFLIKVNSKIILPNYLKHYFNLLNQNNYFLKLLTGGTVKFVNKKNMQQIQVPLPPLETQKKIADVLDMAQELMDKRKRQIKLLDKFLQSIFIDMFGDPVRNTKEWIVKELGDFLINIDSGTSPLCHDYPADETNWGVLKLSAVTGGKYKPKENKLLPLENDINQKLEIHKSDLLITRKNTRDLVGACAFVFETRPKLLLPDTIFRLVTKSNINKVYLWTLFNNSNIKKTIQVLATGSAGSMPNISKAKLYTLFLPIPPLDLQNKFAEIVEATEKQRELMEKSLALMEMNLKGLMQRAFKGELFN